MAFESASPISAKESKYTRKQRYSYQVMNNLCHVYDMRVKERMGGAWEREAHTCEGVRE